MVEGSALKPCLAHCSSVYSCLLDASKAFDRIHYGKLFYILIDKKVPFCIIRLLLDNYIRQEARVTWNESESSYFRLPNGVNKGGVLSPTLFHIYIDRLSCKLRISGFSCHINNTYMGTLFYADDITIVFSIHGLDFMLCKNLFACVIYKF